MNAKAFFKAPERHISQFFSVTMDSHCSFKKAKHLFVHVHYKIHQLNLNDFLIQSSEDLLKFVLHSMVHIFTALLPLIPHNAKITKFFNNSMWKMLKKVRVYGID